MTLLVTLLTPLFLTATAGDAILARLAAAETIRAYRAQTNADLIAIAQIIAFGLAAIASLTQSMDPEVPLPLALRLRGNANACSRAGEQHRRAQALKQDHPAAPDPRAPSPPAPDPAALIAKISETQQRTADHLAGFTPPRSAAPARNQNHAQAAWAAGAARVAAETAAEIASLPEHERHSAAAWAEILNECAKDLMASDPAPRLRPGDRPAFGL